MEDVVARIKAYAIAFYPTILTDLSINDAYLKMVVEDVVDRALAFMNRAQLVEQYEEDLDTYDPEDSDNDAFWKGYAYPIPSNVERALGRQVIASVRSIKAANTATTGAVRSASDNGQSVTFADQLQNYFNSSDDAQLFGGTYEVLKRFRIGNVLTGEYPC
jgi:hypothetical protein